MHDASDGDMTPRCMGGVGAALLLRPGAGVRPSLRMGSWEPELARDLETITLTGTTCQEEHSHHIHDNMTFTQILRCSSNKT